MDCTILKTLRIAKKLKLKDIAPDLGISSGYLSLIERNERQPNVEIIEELCKRLDCELRIIPMI